MKLAVIGATGRTGRHVVTQALDRGHEVTAVARRPEQVEIAHERLRVVSADARDRAALRAAVAGSESIVSAVGAASGRAPTDVCSVAVANELAAMDGDWVRRLAVISASPVGPREEQPAVARAVILPILDVFYGGAYEDMRRMEATLSRRDDLEWACLRPPRLLDRPGTGAYRIDSRPLPQTRSLTRPDLALALLDAVSAENARTGMLYVAN